jgi:hypothetical protein
MTITTMRSSQGPCLKGRGVSAQPLSGGLTNTNFREVDARRTSSASRAPAPSCWPSIARTNTTTRFPPAGCPRVIILATRMHVPIHPGQTMSNESLQRPGCHPHAHSLLQLHAGLRFWKTSTCFA